MSRPRDFLGTFLNLTAILTSDMETFLGLIDTKQR